MYFWIIGFFLVVVEIWLEFKRIIIMSSGSINVDLVDFKLNVLV